MLRRNPVGLVMSLAMTLLTMATTTHGATSFRISMTSATASVLGVEARFVLESEQIGMFITASPQLANGQADLVEGLEVRNAKGEKLAVEPLGAGDWRLPGMTAGQQVVVTYQIRLEHDQYSWGPGKDEVGYRTDEGLFFVARSLFIVPGTNFKNAQVRFELPSGWRASHPWAQEDGVAVAPTAMDLLRNCLFLGKHHEETVQLGDFTFKMVIGGDLWQQRQLFVDAMSPVLPAMQTLFGGMPNENRFLVVINQSNVSDGGAFKNSYSMLINGPVNAASSVVWGHGMAHEVIHFWNGHTLTPTSTQEEWFKEGFTDYLTILARSRAGLDSRDQTYRKMENCMRRYLVSKLLLGIEGNIRDAGAKKHKQRMYVYGGGTYIAFILDVRIRQATDNAKGLDEFMAAMFTAFGKPSKGFELDDIIRVASDVSGVDQSDFFQRYVQGTELLDVAPYAAAAGLQLDTMVDEFYLSPRPDASAQARRIAASIFGAP